MPLRGPEPRETPGAISRNRALRSMNGGLVTVSDTKAPMTARASANAP